MNQTVFEIPKMDCPSEERLVRMALEGKASIAGLDFDLSSRRMTATHDGDAKDILALLLPLGFGAKISESRPLSEAEFKAMPSPRADGEPRSEALALKQLLAINGTMFVAELIAGYFADSAGLIADSLDMFADAAVYSLSLYAVGRSAHLKNRAAKLSGYLQMLLSGIALFSVVKRFMFGSDPEPPYMIGVAFAALIANVTCLFLLARHRQGAVHMKASWIFSTNDVIANVGVIVAGGLVFLTKSNMPDLLIGGIIAVIVFRGALQILKMTSGI